MILIRRAFLPILILAVAATPALAHPLVTGAGFAGGFAHPFLGWDHLLAMTALGLWLGASGQKPWAGALTFGAALALGFVIGAAGVHVPLVEPGILASVLAFGLLAATAVRIPPAIAVPIIAAFAVFHGHAHGAEAPAGAGSAYALGFLAASLVLIVTASLGARLSNRKVLVQRIGLAITAAGAALGFAG